MCLSSAHNMVMLLALLLMLKLGEEAVLAALVQRQQLLCHMPAIQRGMHFEALSVR
jgi:hypothetical protein